MSATVEIFAKAIKTVDPDRLRRRFPDRSLEVEYRSAREFLDVVLAEVDANRQIRTGTLEKLKQCELKFTSIADKLSPKTELGGRSHLNKIYGWVDSGYVERTIFLAGMAEGKEIRQPYRTQIRLLPCNACLFRYRQVYNVWEAGASSDSIGLSEGIVDKLALMKAAYLAQLDHFAEAAYQDDVQHPVAVYYMALSKYLLAEHARVNLDDQAAKILIEQGDLCSNNMPVPGVGIHYMHKQYHKMNFEEFSSFKRLSKKHGGFAEILARNEQIVRNLKDEDMTYPRTVFEIMPYVVVGARGAASVASVGAAFAAAHSLGFDLVQVLVSDIWNQAVSLVPGMNQVDASMVAAIHGGGPAGISAYIHGGGPAA